MTEFLMTSLPGQSIKNVLDNAVQRLKTCDSARLDAELLLCKVLQIDRSQIYSQPGFEIPSEKIHTFRLLLDKRRQGCPVAYLTGHKEFWSLDLFVNHHTLIPRSETECLVEAVLTQVPNVAEYSIADLGTGSGAIALALARERPACRITAIDTSENALVVAKLNAERHNLNQIRFEQSNWFSKIQNAFDVIASNPPYIRSGDKLLRYGDIAHEPVLALDGGEDGLNAIRTIIAQSVNYINPGGRVFIEHGYDQGRNVRELFIQKGYTEVKTLPDYAGLERITSGKSKKNNA
jgi:release factor glutamine methyltransferase